jgi:hypothetical protein
MAGIAATNGLEPIANSGLAEGATNAEFKALSFV